LEPFNILKIEKQSNDKSILLVNVFFETSTIKLDNIVDSNLFV